MKYEPVKVRMETRIEHVRLSRGEYLSIQVQKGDNNPGKLPDYMIELKLDEHDVLVISYSPGENCQLKLVPFE